MTDKIDVIKQALEKGERASISTKDFEYIIEQLQQSNKRIGELETELKNKSMHKCPKCGSEYLNAVGLELYAQIKKEGK